ncbi:MAG: hypothetical protein ABSA13_13995 [Beijerinckiaceae bacterium]|jgi:hypothetical protein
MADTIHLYETGDVVMCELLHGLNGTLPCTIVKQLPPLGTQLQYRVKFNEEKFERVVQEGQLTGMTVAA